MTSEFSEALRITLSSSDSAGTNPTVRREAEQYLIRLTNSPEGLNLAFHIIANEDFDALRAFWAFNAVIAHLPAVAASASPDQAVDIYKTLTGWFNRFCMRGVVPDFVRNKHAQLLVIGMQEFILDGRWGSSFFNDLFELLHRVPSSGPTVGPQIVHYFLQVFDCIDHRVVDRHQQKSREQHQRDSNIKDLMRANCMNTVVDMFYNILTTYYAQLADLTNYCMSVVKNYIDWFEMSLFLNAQWVNLLYFFMTQPSLRASSCECLLSIVEKKQLPQLKFQTISSLMLVTALPQIVPQVLSTPATTEDEEGYLTEIVNLTVASASHLCQCMENDSSLATQASDMLHTIMPQVISLAALPMDPGKESLWLFLQSYVKGPHIIEREATELLHVFVKQSYLPNDDDLYIQHTEFIEQRKQIFTLIRLLYRKSSSHVTQHCTSTLMALNSQGGANGWPQVSYQPLEAALRYLFELGEGLRMDSTLRDPNNEFTKAISFLLQSDVVRHPSPMVHLAYFELMDRFHPYFVHREGTQTILFQFLKCPCGVSNPSDRVRARICYLFSHMSSVLKQQFAPFSEEIANSLQPLLVTPNQQQGHLAGSENRNGSLVGGGIEQNGGNFSSIGHNRGGSVGLSISEKGDLFEALGMIFSTSDIAACAVVANEVAQSIVILTNRARQGASTSQMENLAALVADNVQMLGCFAKGMGGVEATRMPDSPPLGPADINTAHQPLFPLPQEVGSAGGDGERVSSLPKPFPTGGNVFFTVTQCILDSLAIWGSYMIVRDRVYQLFHQVVNILGKDSIPFVHNFLRNVLLLQQQQQQQTTSGTCSSNGMGSRIPSPPPQQQQVTAIGSSSAHELPKALRLALQFVNKTRIAAAEVMGEELVPLFVQTVQLHADVKNLQLFMGVLSESAREQLEIIRQYFSLIHAIVHCGCIQCFEHPNSRSQLPHILETAVLSLRVAVEGEIAKIALQILARIVSYYCTPDSDFEKFFTSTVIPFILDVLTDGSIDLVRDGRALIIISESCLLLRALTQKLGDRFLYALFALLTSPQRNGSLPHNDAHGFCSLLKDEPRVSARMKLIFKDSVLGKLYELRKASG